ncbi:MAG: bifunctional precorrin-2 dehydrogenase/sirohydrochlorin ferrochelatase [Hyphomonadaceae bacterium]
MSNLFPYFPVFLDLAGRSVVLIGGDAAMAGVARQLLAAGASVAVFDAAPTDAMRALAPAARLKLRRWRGSDFQGASLVVCGPDEPRPSRVRTAARAQQAVFHLLGAPENSDVVLGGVSAAGALALGVAAPGAPWAVTEAVRARLAAALPPGLPAFLEAAGRVRAEAGRRIPDDAQRAKFWSEACEQVFVSPQMKPAEWEKLLLKWLAD